MKSVVTILLLIVAAIAITSGYTLNINKPLQANVQFNIKDLPEKGLTVIGPSDPAYNGMISALLNGKSNSAVEALRPFSIFIKNTSSKTMVGCLLKWELIRSDGRVLTDKRDYIALWSLMGTAITDSSDAVVRPNATQFFTPSYLDINQIINGNNTNDPNVAEYLKQRRSELDQLISITISIDGAFFDDGTFIGPDTAGFFGKVEAMRNARRDLLQEIKQKVQQRAGNDEVFRYIEEAANSPKIDVNSASSLSSDSYNNFRRETAQELLRSKSASNETQVIEQVMRKLQKPWPTLRKS